MSNTHTTKGTAMKTATPKINAPAAYAALAPAVGRLSDAHVISLLRLAIAKGPEADPFVLAAFRAEAAHRGLSY